MTGEITEYIEGKLLRANITGDMFGMDVSYRLNSLSDMQTEMTQQTQIKFNGFMKFIAPIFLFLAKLSSNNPQAKAHATLKEMAQREYQSQLS